VRLAAALTTVGAGTAGAVIAGLAAIAGAYELYKHTEPTAEETAKNPNHRTPWAKRIQDWTDRAVGRDTVISNVLRKAGYSEQQAYGLVQMLRGENSDLDPDKQQPDGPGYGIAQWGVRRQKDFQQWMNQFGSGHNVHDSSLEEQARFMAFEMSPEGHESAVGRLIRATNNWQAVTDIGVRQYERPANPNGELGRVFNSRTETTIHVNGVTDPRATAKLVADEQKRIAERNNSMCMREFSSAVQ
jgi:hypothetical protein